MKVVDRTLDELGDVSRGRSRHRPRDAAHLYGGPYPFVQTGDVKSAGLYLTNYTQTYSEAGLAQSKLWKIGTLCITIAANIADTAILGIDACFPDSIIGFIADQTKADVRFIKYMFDAKLKHQYRTFSQGVAQDNLSQEKLLSIKFQVPEKVADQTRIADVLAAYDELIWKNVRRIELLERSARLLFEEWFVRMRYPGHEHDKIVGGLPVGWERKALEDLANITFGQSPKSEFYNENGIGLPFHQGVADFGTRFVLDRVYCTAAGKTGNPGDILFSVRAPVGRINLTRNKIMLGRGLAAIASKDGKQKFLFYALKQIFFKDDLMGSGAIFAAITSKDLRTVLVTIPKPPLIDEFQLIAGPIDRQIQVLSESINAAAQGRSLLLPRLMDGRIEV